MHRHPTIAAPISRRLARLLCVFLLCVVSAVFPGPASAATPAEMRKAEALATEAKVFFGSKLYKDAALQFMEAFALSRRPNLVYNAARAYEEGGFLKKSVALFRYYQTLDGVDAAGKTAARKHMVALEAKLAAANAAEEAKRAAVAKAAASEAARAAAAAQATKAQRDKTRAAQVAAQRAEDARRAAAARRPAPVKRELNRWWAGATAAALITSGVAYGVALSQANDMSASDVVDDVTRDRYLSNRDSAQAWRGFAVGAGVIGAGLAGWTAWQWWAGVQPKKGATNLWIAPVVGPTRSGFIAGLHF